MPCVISPSCANLLRSNQSKFIKTNKYCMHVAERPNTLGFWEASVLERGESHRIQDGCVWNVLLATAFCGGDDACSCSSDFHVIASKMPKAKKSLKFRVPWCESYTFALRVVDACKMYFNWLVAMKLLPEYPFIRSVFTFTWGCAAGLSAHWPYARHPPTCLKQRYR